MWNSQPVNQSTYGVREHVLSGNDPTLRVFDLEIIEAHPFLDSPFRELNPLGHPEFPGGGFPCDSMAGQPSWVLVLPTVRTWCPSRGVFPPAERRAPPANHG